MGSQSFQEDTWPRRRKWSSANLWTRTVTCGHLLTIPWFFSDLIRVGLPDTPVTYQGKLQVKSSPNGFNSVKYYNLSKYAKCYINSLGVYSFQVDVFWLCQTQQNIKWLVVIDQHEPMSLVWHYFYIQNVEFWLFHRAMQLCLSFPAVDLKMSSKCRLWHTLTNSSTSDCQTRSNMFGEIHPDCY